MLFWMGFNFKFIQNNVCWGVDAKGVCELGMQIFSDCIWICDRDDMIRRGKWRYMLIVCVLRVMVIGEGIIIIFYRLRYMLSVGGREKG